MAAATTIVTAGLSAAGAGANFAQAVRSNRMAKQAEQAAAKFMADARKRMEVNFMEGVQVPTEAYEIAARQNLAQSQQATQALRETDQRAVIGGIQGVQEQGAQAAERLRTGLQEDLFRRDLMVAQEDSRLRDQMAELDLAEVTGAQRAMADQERLRAQSIGSAFGLLGQGAVDVFSSAPLYGMSRDDRRMVRAGIDPLNPSFPQLDQRIQPAVDISAQMRQQQGNIMANTPGVMSDFDLFRSFASPGN